MERKRKPETTEEPTQSRKRRQTNGGRASKRDSDQTVGASGGSKKSQAVQVAVDDGEETGFTVEVGSIMFELA